MTVAPQLVKWQYRQASENRKEPDTTATVAGVGVDWSYREVGPPNQIQFTSHHVGVVTAWLWDPGDGSGTSTDVNLNHQYVFSGVSADFVVRLTVNASVFEQKTITVTNPIAAPVATALVAQDLTINQVINMTVFQAADMKAIA